MELRSLFFFTHICLTDFLQYQYQEKPHDLATVVSWLLIKEREILDSAQLAQQVKPSRGTG